nr:MAG TPA: hypothetical protein [Caudoviricetes sp.]
MDNFVTVVQGNDFTLNIALSTPNKETQAPDPYDIRDAKSLEVKLISQINGHVLRLAPFKIVGKNVISTLVSGTKLKLTDYDVEVSFVKGGLNKRAYECNIIHVVRCQGDTDYSTQDTEGENGYGIDLTMGINLEVVNLGKNVNTGGSGTSDYNDLEHKPSINDVVLEGNKTLEDLGIMSSDKAYTKEEVNQALETKPDKTLVDSLSQKVDSLEESLKGKANTTDIPTRLSELENDLKTKTINGQSIFGEGNIEIPGGSGTGGQENVIEKIKVNGTELPVENKEVNIRVPTKVSELENDSNFLTKHQDLSNYVQKEEGKGLSTKDFTQEDKDKLDGMEEGAQKNVQPDWNAEPGAPGAILNKPDIPGGSITVDAELDAESTNAVQNKAVTKAITELQDYCFPTSLEASISPSSAEWTGNSVEVSVSFRVLRNSKPVVADTVQIQFNGETKTLENVAEGSEKFTLSTLGYKSGSVTAKKGSTTIKNSPRSISANLYLPVYYGFSKATTGNELTITSLTKGGSSLNGTKTLTNDDATKYLWLCVPNTMSINKVTSSGFDVPFLAPVEASTPLGTYKCYRTQDLPGAGSMTIVIS